MEHRLRELRDSKKLGGKEVAEYLGISTQYIYDIEKNKRGLSSDIAIRLADYYKVTTDYLLGVSDVNLYGITDVNVSYDDEDLWLSEVAEDFSQLSNRMQLSIYNLLKACLKETEDKREKAKLKDDKPRRKPVIVWKQ